MRGLAKNVDEYSLSLKFKYSCGGAKVECNLRVHWWLRFVGNYERSGGLTAGASVELNQLMEDGRFAEP